MKQKEILFYFLSFIFLVLPFSLPTSLGQHQVELPTEPLLVILGSFSLWYTYQVQAWKTAFFQHPLFWVALAYIIWGGVCTIFAQHFHVSAKYTAVSITHWWIYFCLWGILFNKSNKYFTPWLLYSISFTVILFYAWWQHSQYHFSVATSVLVARPFYFDHALYGSTALLLLGLLLAQWWKKTKYIGPWALMLFGGLFLLGVYLSFSRAAWLSLFGTMAIIMFIAYFRPSFKQFIGSVSVFVFFITIALIVLIPQKGSQVLSKQGDSWQHLRSSLNVSTDVSNMERLNRYSCAWRMFKTKPILGYGPGNFIMDYYAFQRPEEMTRLSVEQHQKHRPGKGGGSHSQYLQALSEMGFVGFLLWLSLILMSIRTGIHIVKKANTRETKYLALGILFSLITFFIHSLFNNFYHQEKIMALVWSGLATLILLDQDSLSNKD